MISQIEGDKLCVFLSKGSFSLSEECEKEYQKRVGIKPNVQERLLIPFRFDPDTPPGPINIRIDPVLFALYREKGSEWCSGGKLFLACIPSYFSEYFDISFEDDTEIISIDIQVLLENILEDFLHSTKASLEDTTNLRMSSECTLLSVSEDIQRDKNKLVKHIKFLEEHYAILRQSEERIIPYSEYVKVLEDKWNAARDAIKTVASTVVEPGWSVVKKRTTNKPKKDLNPVIQISKPSVNPFSYLYDDN